MSIELTAVASLVGSVIAAGAAYVFTKWREREEEWRKDKREFYKAFVASLSDVVEGESTLVGQVAFNLATNNLSLIAPQRVIEALIEYRKEVSISNPDRRQDRFEQVMSRLLYEMRKDLGMSPRDNEGTFRVLLWSAGIPKTNMPPVSQRLERI